MKAYKLFGGIAIVASIALTGVASAQVVSAPTGPVNVTTTQSTTGITPGATATNFGTIMLSANNGSTYSITSIPITVTPGAGASTADLTACQLMSSGGTALTTGNNRVNTIGSGTNIFTFDTPLIVTGATTTITVNCNVNSTAASGTTLAFLAGTPTATMTSGVTINNTASSNLGVIVNTIPSVKAGTQNALLAILTLDGTGSNTNANVTSIPLTITENNALPADFTNCSLHSATNFATALNTGTNAMSALQTSGGVSNFTLDTPFSVPAGAGELLELTCNVSSATPTGSSVMISVLPSAIMASNTSNGSAITPTTSMSNGTAEPISGTVEIMAPNTTTTSTGTTGTSPVTTTVPGTPNTGAGGNAGMNFAFLAISAAVLVIAGGAFALRKV
jgi:hypothetical protein